MQRLTRNLALSLILLFPASTLLADPNPAPETGPNDSSLFTFFGKNTQSQYKRADFYENFPFDTSASETSLLIEPVDSQVQTLLKHAKTFIGTPYVMGGNSKKGIDCSGFTVQSFQKIGLELPRTAALQSSLGKSVKRNQLVAGDLLFFKGRNIKSSRVGHVGIVVSRNGNRVSFIHASTSRGVVIDDLDMKYFAIRYLWARRIL